jgi:hypothetical protein
MYAPERVGMSEALGLSNMTLNLSYRGVELDAGAFSRIPIILSG